MLARRAFLIWCGSLAAGLAPKSLRAKGSPAVSLPQQPDTEETPAVVFHITGWETPLDSQESARGRVWISINGSWRAAWR
jgi:hypothetical protein